MQQKLAFSRGDGKHSWVYFDHAATHPMSETAKAAWLAAAEQFPANPSSRHRAGARADRALEGARERVAEILECRPGEVMFTSGATESNNLFIHHLAHAFPGEILISSLEHPSVLAPARRWLGQRHALIPATPSGIVDLDWLSARLKTRKPDAVVLMAANNETGVVQPWPTALALCQEHGVSFACDAAQFLGKLPARPLGSCTMLSGCAHKFGGPPGVGILKAPGLLHPMFLGGHQEDGRRAGTENLPGILSLVAAWGEREQQLASGGADQRLPWRDRFVNEALRLLPGCELLGTGEPRLWNTATLLLPERSDKRQWVVALDRLGIAVSSGSACSSGETRPSHVLAAMGRPGDHAARMVRFSSGWETPAAAWPALLEALKSAAP
jgi:cysteine desulfurase